MSTSPDLDIRGHLTRLRFGTCSLSEFWRWFGDTIDMADPIVDDDTWGLFLAVENVFAEYSGGHLTTEQAETTLARLVKTEAVGDPVPSR